ncbi:16S rRNA (guanine(966)-N(2))-methyltransferase RsmD [Candidatus Omnitrophota bacterium]
MRIIAGKFKGRVIEMPKGIRPTSDKVRQALFEMYKNRIEGANFLDLYCGSGAVGIEAFSRGAKSSTFVDDNSQCIATLKKNLSHLHILDLSTLYIYKRGVVEALKALKDSSRTFDIVFLDPPYYKNMAKNTLIALSDCDILARNALIIVELYKKEGLPEEVGKLKKIRTSFYGDTILESFRK